MIYCDVAGHTKLAGIAYGRALDHKVGPTWKLDILTQAKTMQDLLQNAYAMSDDEAIARAQKIVSEAKYDYNSISKSVDKVLLPYLDEVNANQTSYQQESGIEMQIYAPLVDESNLHLKKQLHPETTEYMLNTNTYLFARPYGEFAIMPDRDNAIVVDYNDASYMYYYNTSPFDNKVHWQQKFKISSDAKLVIDGKEISASEFINKNMRVAYSKLKIETNKINVYARGMSGVLEASNGVIKLKTTITIDSKAAQAKLIESRKKAHDKFIFGHNRQILN
jgi:hypothetical protein